MTDLTQESLTRLIEAIQTEALAKAMSWDGVAPGVYTYKVYPTRLFIAPAMHRQAIHLLFFKGRIQIRKGVRGRKYSLHWRVK